MAVNSDPERDFQVSSTTRQAVQQSSECCHSDIDADRTALGLVRISSSEQRQRQQAVDYARASVGLEGFALSADDERKAQRFIVGEIDLPTFVSPTNST